MIDPTIIEAMTHEMAKQAFLGGLASGAARAVTSQGTKSAIQAAARGTGQYLARSAGNAGAGMGIGAVGGGLIGAAHGAYKGYQKDPEQEDSGGIAGALSGGLSGGSRGILVGGALGGLAGLASGGRGAEAVAKATKGAYNPLGLAARAGQRTLHSVTGLVPGGATRGTDAYAAALKGIDVGGLGTLAKSVETAESAVANAAAPKKTLVQRALGRDASPANAKNIDRARSALDTARSRLRAGTASAQAGQTSLVGLGQNFAEKGALEGSKDVLHAAGSHLKNQGALGAALTVGSAGIPLAQEALIANNQEDPKAPSKAQRLGEAAGEGTTRLLTPMIGSAGGATLGTAGRYAGGSIGKGIGKLVGATRRPSGTGLGAGAATPGAQPDLTGPPVQREYTNAALGKPPEGLQV